MKNKLALFLVLVLGLLIFTGCGRDFGEYESLDLSETLAEAEIEMTEKYNPREDAITIYLFRGQGCGYCHAFLEFLNSIADKYGKYFVLKSYEVWNSQENSELMAEVSSYLGEQAGGVPYIVIGEEVFTGYTAEYDDAIKSAITDLYKTKPSKRYDIFKEMKKHPKKSEFATPFDVVVLSLCISLIMGGLTMIYTNKKLAELRNYIAEVTKKEETVAAKKSTPRKTTTKETKATTKKSTTKNKK